MKGARRRKLVELSCQILKLVPCLARIAGVDGSFEMLDLRFYHALSRTVNDPPFGILTNSFLGR